MLQNNQSLIDNDEWEVLTPSGWQDFSGILITENQDTITIDSGLTCTENHRVLRDGEWVEAK